MALTTGEPGQRLLIAFKWQYQGPAKKVWIGAYLGKSGHLELGLWGKVGRYYDLPEQYTFQDAWITLDENATPEQDKPIVFVITEAMRGKTFDVLRVVADREPANDASDLSAVRFDDDWDDSVLEVPGLPRAEAHIYPDWGEYKVVD